MSDVALAGRLADDLDLAFPALVRGHQDRVFSLALRLTSDRGDAEELAHDVFVRAYQALVGYDPDRTRKLALRPWLATIALNAARNESRRAGRGVPQVASRVGADPADAATARIAVVGALRKLPAHQRESVVLRHVGGLTYGEIADVLDRPVGTVKADVHRGMNALRSTLGDDHDDHDDDQENR